MLAIALCLLCFAIEYSFDRAQAGTSIPIDYRFDF